MCSECESERGNGKRKEIELAWNGEGRKEANVGGRMKMRGNKEREEGEKKTREKRERESSLANFNLIFQNQMLTYQEWFYVIFNEASHRVSRKPIKNVLHLRRISPDIT